jgi:hypothetical protein
LLLLLLLLLLLFFSFVCWVLHVGSGKPPSSPTAGHSLGGLFEHASERMLHASFMRDDKDPLGLPAWQKEMCMNSLVALCFGNGFRFLFRFRFRFWFLFLFRFWIWIWIELFVLFVELRSFVRLIR